MTSLNELLNQSVRSVREHLIDLRQYGETDEDLKALLDSCEKFINRGESDDDRT